MRKEEKAALDVLAKASDVHNCWAILDDAVTSGEDDQFTKEYIDGEREMLEGSIKGTIRALGALGGLYGIAVSTQNDNGSYAYMRKVREEHLTELERAAEFDRGYRAGQRAMSAEKSSERGDHGDCAERRRTGAAGGDTDVDEPAEIRAVSNEIADMLREMDNGHSRTCPESDEEVSESAPSVSIADELSEMDAGLDANGTCPNDVTISSITDELRLWASTEVPYRYGHQLCSIADRIEEQFARVCQQHEAVLQSTIEQMTDENLTVKDERDHLRKQMDQQRAMLTEQRDAERAKVISLCNECDEWKRGSERDADKLESLVGAYNDMERERDELQAKLDKANGENKGLRLSIDEQKESIAQRKKTIKKLTRDNEKVWKTAHELQAKLDEIAGVLGG